VSVGSPAPGRAPAQFRTSRGSPVGDRSANIRHRGHRSKAKYPQLLIVDSPPTWMDEAELARMRETPLWLDEDPPQGLLRALVADRERE
jgi:hypothetical protein